MHKFKLPFFMLLSVAIIFIIDQSIKNFFIDKAIEIYKLPLNDLYHNAVDIYTTQCINMRLVFNYGVAFSMFAFLEENLKWIQLLLIFAAALYVLKLQKFCYAIPAGILVGAGFSNVYDRFIHGGVVDYVYWHCGFNFAIFNFADVMIDVAVAWILLLNLKPRMCE